MILEKDQCEKWKKKVSHIAKDEINLPVCYKTDCERYLNIQEPSSRRDII